MFHRFIKKRISSTAVCSHQISVCLSPCQFCTVCALVTCRVRSQGKLNFPDCRRTSVMAAFLLQIPQSKPSFPTLIVVDTVWIWLSQMLLKTQNNQHFWANNLLRALLPNLAVGSSGRSFNCDSFYKQRVEMKFEGLTYNSNRQPLFISSVIASSSFVFSSSTLEPDHSLSSMARRRSEANVETMDSLWQKKTEGGHRSNWESHCTESMSQLTAIDSILNCP